MKVLFVLSMTSLIRHFEGVVVALAKRGHTIRIATPGRETNWPLPDTLAANSRISETTCPDGRSDEWAGSARLLRLAVDYCRFFQPAFADAEKLRERARAAFFAALTDGEERRLFGRCPSCNTRILNDDLARLVLAAGAGAAANVAELVRLVESAIPPDPAHMQFLDDERPDVLLVTPLVGLGSDQAEWVKAARVRSIPVGFPVFSWDNLTTKGVLHEQPDQVFVWNDIQKREAEEYHRVPEHRVVVTGAPRFDAFLALTPKRDRATFCAKYGLDADKPIVTYLCSSEFVAEREAAFVTEWITEIRRDPLLRTANIVVRPHPRHEAQWSSVDLPALGPVAVTMPKSMNADRLLYDTLFHSAAVVGLNTSAQIEAALLDKPVLTLLAPGFERGQQGTLHFSYLLEDRGGFVRVARDFDEHRQQLANALEGGHDAPALRTFVERFVRPSGLDRPVAPLLADAIERLASGAPRAGLSRWLTPLGSIVGR
jgi:hypothetical protein